MTCLPAGSADDVPATARNNILFWYPMVGVAIGFILILGEWLAAPLPDFLQAALLVTLWGDYHRRSSFGWAGGLRRCLGGRTGQSGKNLKIMEDPRCGTMEAVYLLIPYRTDSGESDQIDEFEVAISKSCSSDPQFLNQAAKNGTKKPQNCSSNHRFFVFQPHFTLIS